MSENKTVFTLEIGDYPKEITELTRPALVRYANKIGAELHVISERKFPGFPPAYEKLQIHELGRTNDWNIYVDADALVHPDMFDVTEHLRKDTVMHHGFDMAGNRWLYDDYFRRDGRHIGSCNWFTVGSNWCLDLWAPLTDMTPEQALSNIMPTMFESASGVMRCPKCNRETPAITENSAAIICQCGDTATWRRKPVITKDHLLDDYVLSRNIARYGLKAKNFIDLLKDLGRSGDNYFYHEYTIATEEKVSRLKSTIVAWGLGAK